VTADRAGWADRVSRPNHVLQQTGHAIDSFPSFNAFFRVSRLLSVAVQLSS
jgi:hypothetical protein